MPLKLKFTEDIAAPPERVFAALTDLEGARDWMEGFVRLDPLTGPDFQVGTRWREVRRMFGREASEEFEVTGLEPNRSVDLYIDGTKGSSRRGWYRFRYDLEPAGDRTVLHLHGELGGMGFFGELFGRLFLGFFRNALSKDLAAMKRHVEGPTPGR